MINSKFFLVFDKKAYFYPFEEKCIHPIKSGLYLWVYRFINKLKLPIPKIIIKKELLDSEINTIVFTDTVFSKTLFNFFKKRNINCYLYYMNTISKSNEYMLNYFDMINVYSFEKKDCIKYGLNYLHTPYSDKIKLSENKVLYDTCFIGREKNRKDLISDLYSTLRANGLKNNFMVLDGTSEYKEINQNNYTSYKEYLEIVSMSKCIIEILSKEQTSNTLRSLEALFFNKKLITNFTDIKKEHFYSKKNVFILGEDNMDDITLFLNSPLEYPIAKKEYEFEEWLDNFK